MNQRSVEQSKIKEIEVKFKRGDDSEETVILTASTVSIIAEKRELTGQDAQFINELRQRFLGSNGLY
ncbi:MAG TPA: hypothetical protein VGA67_00200 [Candidatus Dojkabacteria bacterium]|jgi:hypothetical protein